MPTEMSFLRPLRRWPWGWLLLAALIVGAGNRLVLRSPDPYQLRFAHSFTTESEQAILKAVIAEFEAKHPPYKIEQVILNSETYQTIGWRLLFQGRKQPDVFFLWQGYKVDYAIARGWAKDVTSYVSPSFREQFVPSVVAPQHGGLYLLPQSVDISNLVWYNRELFARLGLTEPRTLEEWETLCAKLRAEKLLPLAQGNRDLWPMGNFGAELMGQTLGAEALSQLFAPKSPVKVADLRGLQTFLQMTQSGTLDLPGVLEPGAVGNLNDTEAKILFLTGKSAQHAVGSWFMADIADARSKDELKFTPGLFSIPSRTGEGDAITSVTTGYMVNRACAHPEKAVAFLELLLSREYQSRFAQLGNLSARRDAAEFTTDPLAQRMLAVLGETRTMVPPPDTGYSPDQANIFYEICARLLTGRLTLETAADYWTEQKASLARKGL